MTSSTWVWAGMMVGAYLLGSIPFGVVVSRCLGTMDPRTAGSQNIGFTNVLRLSGRTAGILTLAGDLGKGWLVAWGGQYLAGDSIAALGIALSVIVGHVYSIFLRFRGGKGVATAMGAVLGIDPLLGLALVGAWLIAFALCRYSSGAALVSFVVLPILALGLGRQGTTPTVVFCVVVSAVIILRHKDNMIRLWQGTEPRAGGAS